jgi:hypothetical protein
MHSRRNDDIWTGNLLLQAFGGTAFGRSRLPSRIALAGIPDIRPLVPTITHLLAARILSAFRVSTQRASLTRSLTSRSRAFDQNILIRPLATAKGALRFHLPRVSRGRHRNNQNRGKKDFFD